MAARWNQQHARHLLRLTHFAAGEIPIGFLQKASQPGFQHLGPVARTTVDILDLECSKEAHSAQRGILEGLQSRSSASIRTPQPLHPSTPHRRPEQPPTPSKDTYLSRQQVGSDASPLHIAAAWRASEVLTVVKYPFGEAQ